MDVDNEKKKRANGMWSVCMAKGKAICLGGGLVILLGLLQGACSKSDGLGRNWTYSDMDFYSVVNGDAMEDEGTVYYFDGKGLKVFPNMREGVWVESTRQGNKIIWVVTKKRYQPGEALDEGYYIRRGSYEYTSASGAEKTVARYVEVTGSFLEKVKKQIEDEKAAEEKSRKAEEEAREAEEEAKKAQRKAALKALGLDVAGTRAGETKTITLPGGATMEMVWCPSGSFRMGNKDGNNGERRVHKVKLPQGFWMAKTEVTQAQWKSVMGDNPSDHEGDDLPVENVNWNVCQKFCEKTGLSLPTEAEWEYACRAGSKGPYAGTGRLEDMGWYDDNSGNKTHPVGQKQPNVWGLYDMHGNVQEWCADCMSEAPSMAYYRVTRGGGCRNDASSCQSACRFGVPAHVWSVSIGFRPIARQD